LISDETMQSDFDLDIDLDLDSDNILPEQTSNVPAIINRIRELNIFEESEIDEESIVDIINSLSKSELPRFELNVDNKKVVKFSTDLVYGLDLELSYKKLIGRTTLTFDENVTYDKDESSKFRNLITIKDGYLSKDENFFEVDSSKLSKNTKVTTLVNTRVILFWRNVRLEDTVKKRIISLGLLYLMRKISKAELLFYIREILPSGSLEVTIRYKVNTYVLIGVESPLFNT
jgi:hypothetical protein